MMLFTLCPLLFDSVSYDMLSTNLFTQTPFADGSYFNGTSFVYKAKGLTPNIPVRVGVFDMSGRHLLETTIFPTSTEVESLLETNISYSNGMYLIVSEQENGLSSRKKVVVAR